MPTTALAPSDCARCSIRSNTSSRDRANNSAYSLTSPPTIPRRLARISFPIARARTVFQKLAEEELEHLGTLEARYKQLLDEDPKLEAYPTFLFFKGAANGLFASGTEQLLQVIDDRKALMLGIRCERGSHRFFKRYGERFEDSEGKRIFLEFAAEEREHLNLLIKEYRTLVSDERKPRRRAKRRESKTV